MKEFELIDHIRKKFSVISRHENLLVPIGDDCSILIPPRGMTQVTTMDSLVEGNHISLHYFTPREIGRKSMRVNLSDLASMGARGPFFAWVVFAIPKGMSEEVIKGIVDGIKSDCKKYGIVLAGGNITSSQEFHIHVTLTGWTGRKEILTRSGARSGDLIFLSGTIGASTLAYRQFKEGKEPDPSLLKRWANPDPRIKLGRVLAARKIATSCIDVSDGIFQDLTHITQRSGAGAEVLWTTLPIDSAMKKYHPDPSMIGFGEDYELLFTVPKNRIKLLSEIKEPITEIGKITGSRVRVFDAAGKEMKVKDVGFSHLT